MGMYAGPRSNIKSGGAETQKYDRPDAEVKKWGG